MIIKNDFFNNENDYLKKEKEGLMKAVNKLDERFKNNEVDREKFLKQNEEFAKRHVEINKKIEKLNRH